MESMKSLALNGRLVISVIHQPRSSIYEMFDRLLLLSCGRVMFLGKKAAGRNIRLLDTQECLQEDLYSSQPIDFIDLIDLFQIPR
jgi:ABC-type multidrug transport system ATPase subunit